MLSVTDVRQFFLGVQGENEEQTITVDVKPWLASYPNGIVSIWHKRNGESVPTPTGAVYDAEAGTITWTPTYTDTYVAGEGEAEIRLYENGVIKKTRVVRTGVAPSVTGAAGVTLESGWQGMINYIDSVVEEAKEAADDAGDAAEAAEDAKGAAEAAQTAAEDAQTAAETAQTAAETAQTGAESAQSAAETAKDAAEAAMMHYPYVDPTTGNWMLWDPETGAWVNTGVHAQGPTGAVPDIQIGTVTTLLPDQPATVTRRSGSPDEEPIFDFGIPKGDTGTAENIYGNTIDMSALDSTKVSAAIGAKADKVSGATSGNFAGLDSNGNLTDSGSKASDFLTSHQDISGKADKVSGATSGNIATLDANGNLQDGGHAPGDYLPTANVYEGTDKTTAGYALDARTGNTLNSSISNIRKGTGFQAKLSSGNWILNSGEDAVAGDYIWKNGVLGQATAAITGGSTAIVENTNWVKCPAKGALSELSAAGIRQEITIPANGWSNSSPYTYTWQSANVTAACRVEFQFGNGTPGEVPYLDAEKTTGGIIFTAPSKPTQDIPVVINIINAQATAITQVRGDMVTTSSISGANNVDSALTALDNAKARVLQLNSTDNTWAKVWDKINLLASGETADIYINGTQLGLITSSELTSTMFGTVTRNGSGDFHFTLITTSGNIYTVSVTGATSSATGTCSWKVANAGRSVGNSSDMDDYTTFGDYYSASSSVSATLSHAPITGAGFTMSVRTRGINVDQIAQSQDAIRIRGKSTSGWTEWMSLAKISTKSIESNTSAVFTLENNVKGIILVAGNVAERSGIYAVSCSNSGGTVSVFPLVTASGITMNTSTAYKLTVTSTGAATISVISVRGNITVA